MTDESLAFLRYHFATARVPVDVMTCTACAAEFVISPAVATENGLPQRCAKCAHRELTHRRFRVEGGSPVEEV